MLRPGRGWGGWRLLSLGLLGRDIVKKVSETIIEKGRLVLVFGDVSMQPWYDHGHSGLGMG